DVITMHQHEVKNVVASSGTSLTSRQINILQRYAGRIIMIYDADSAGQSAMERGMNIALTEGMDVHLMELPEGEDPDSFIKQFGKESFLEFKKKNAEDFVTFSIHKAEKAGKMERPGDRSATINSILESISLIPSELDRQVFVQHLHQKTQKYRKGTDRELFQQLEKIVAENKKKRSYRTPQKQVTPPHLRNEENDKPTETSSGKRTQRRPKYEMEMIRLLLQYGEKMRQFIGHNVGDTHFEDDELRNFYKDIMQRHIDKAEISIEHYTNRESPYPSLLGDIMLERYSVSDFHGAKSGSEYARDQYPYKTAKSTMRHLHLEFLERNRKEVSNQIKEAKEEQKVKLMQMITKLQKEISRIRKNTPDELFEDPKFQ
ncbi:MAG: toprim domain-containing protein, partial [Balneolaceae bacterium]